MTWKKYPTEELIIPADWSELCDGDPVSGAVGVEVVGTAGGLVATILSTTDYVSSVKIAGGTADDKLNLRFAVNTVGGQKFRPVKTVLILSDVEPVYS